MKEHIKISDIRMIKNIAENIKKIKQEIPNNITLIAVSKLQNIEKITDAYDAGHRDFGENYVQELKEKYLQLPKDIRWHFIGHLQSNKIKYIAPFVYLIHGIDNFKLLKEVDKQAKKYNKIINCLLQIHIAQEENKFGFDKTELMQLLENTELSALNNIRIKGLMGMTSLTTNTQQIEKEFQIIKYLFEEIKNNFHHLPNVEMSVLSTGMSNDYSIALKYGATHIRIGTAIFGERIQTD